MQTVDQALFEKQGYVVMPNALSADELAMLQSVCDELLEEKPQDGGANMHTIGLGERRRFLRHRHADFPALNDFVLGDKMAAISGGVLGGSTYLFNEQFVVKGANQGASFAWHQDSGYVGFDHKAYVTVWIALDDTTIENGCVYVLPRNLQKEPGIDEHIWDDENNEYIGYRGDQPGEAMVCPAGSIVAFSSLTQHRSGENVTNKRRRAYIAQYSVEPIRDPNTGDLKRFATPVGRKEAAE